MAYMDLVRKGSTMESNFLFFPYICTVPMIKAHLVLLIKAAKLS